MSEQRLVDMAVQELLASWEYLGADRATQIAAITGFLMQKCDLSKQTAWQVACKAVAGVEAQGDAWFDLAASTNNCLFVTLAGERVGLTVEMLRELLLVQAQQAKTEHV